MDKVPITRGGYERLFWRLQYLRRHARKEVAQALASARAGGITPHNLEWRTAREKQAWVEARIEELERMLASCEVVVAELNCTDRADFGLLVKVYCPDSGQVTVYQLVGPYESDVSAGRLSIDSPAGQAVFGRAKGEWVTFLAPSGLRSLRILDVFPPAEAACRRL